MIWQSHLAYHPRIGLTYSPSFKGRLPHEGGGYLLRSNSAGFRSEHEFAAERAPGVSRVLLFGDSQTAGLGVSNQKRYGDLIEKSTPGLEVFNFAIDGIGIDQEYLAYLEHSQIEHDLVVIGLYVDDASRVSSPYFRCADPHGRRLYYPKPYYTLGDNVLSLHQVPVPKEIWTEESVPQQRMPASRKPVGLVSKIFDTMRRVVPNPTFWRAIMGSRLGTSLRRARRVQRAPEYASPDDAGWQLLSAILAMWIAKSRTPVLLVPIPVRAFVYGESDPTDYQSRFRELAAATQCALHDPLPDLLSYAPAVRHEFFFLDTHLSASGHQAVAKSLQPTIARLMRNGTASQP